MAVKNNSSLRERIIAFFTGRRGERRTSTRRSARGQETPKQAYAELEEEIKSLRARLATALNVASTAREEAQSAEVRASELRAELDRMRRELAEARKEVAALRGQQSQRSRGKIQEEKATSKAAEVVTTEAEAAAPDPLSSPNSVSTKAQKTRLPVGISFRVPPTDEQEEVIAAALEGRGLALQAYAGCGKTSTLNMVATALQHKQRQRIQYITFNRQLVREAQTAFANNADCHTMHALAFRQMVRRYPAMGGLLKRRLSPSFIAEHLGTHSYQGSREISAQAIAYCALDTLSKYTSSRDDEINLSHVSLPAALPDLKDEETQEVKNYVLEVARKVWAEQTKFQTWPISHDTYLKVWALERPSIGADVILFDETQDATPLFIQIVEEQEKRGAQVVWVGDGYQQIYEWRGAINAMARVQADRLYLTKSFRFGPKIARCANEIIVGVFQDKPLIGVGKAQDQGRQAILCRTNGEVISQVFAHSNEKPAIVGKQDVITLLDDIQSLQRGQPKGQFSAFRDFQELLEYADTEEGQSLRPILKLIRDYGIETLINTIKDLEEDNPNASLTITTIHRAKGREWDWVSVIASWPAIEDMREEDWRLLYVAITRARVEVNYQKPKPKGKLR